MRVSFNFPTGQLQLRESESLSTHYRRISHCAGGEDLNCRSGLQNQHVSHRRSAYVIGFGLHGAMDVQKTR